MSESRECVESRLAARGDGIGKRELLDAVGTLLKGCENSYKFEFTSLGCSEIPF